MKSIRLTNVTIDLPVDPMIEAIGPEIVKALALKQIEKQETRAVRPPILALRTAADRLSRALTAYENSLQSPSERASLDTLLDAAIGVRSANLALKKEN